MNMVDANSDDFNVPVQQQPNSISDEEIIRRSIETMHKGEPTSKVQLVQPVERQQGMQMQTESSIQTVGNDSNYWPIKDLPSSYRFYPEGAMIYGRPLKVIEIKKLSSINADNYDFIINDIIKRATKGINYEDIYLADKLYIVLWLRANSYRDSSYQVDYTCNKCQVKSSYHFDVDNLEVQHITPEYDPTKELKLNNGDVIKIKFLTIKDSMTIERFKEINKETIGEIDDELLSMSCMISEINNNRGTPLERYNYILDLSPENFSYISTYIEKMGMGIKPHVNIKCKDCGGNAQIGITFQSDFFFPTYRAN